MSNTSIKILLVDDEPDILEILSYNLSAEGYQISTASNGVEAVKKAKKTSSTFDYYGCDDARNGRY